MTTVYDIPADILIRQVAEELKKNPQIQPPDWAAFAKTGVHKEMPPENDDWWYVRQRSSAYICSGRIRDAWRQTHRSSAPISSGRSAPLSKGFQRSAAEASPTR